MVPLSLNLTTGSSSVDLSRLPPPTIVEQISYETILAGMTADLRARLPDFDATVESDPAVKILQVAAYREMLNRQQFNDRARGVMLAYARGSDLDQLAALVGVQRLVIRPADPVTGAAAEMEPDDALRQRAVLAPESFSVAGPAAQAASRSWVRFAGAPSRLRGWPLAMMPPDSVFTHG